MKKFFESLLAVAGVVFLLTMSYVAFSYLSNKQSAKLGDSGLPNTFLSATNGKVTVSPATSTTVLALNGIRQYASICNDSANVVYLSFGVPAATSTGIRLASATCYETNNTKSYLGAINAIASTSSSTLMTVEK
jgi:hypothetical protein